MNERIILYPSSKPSVSPYGLEDKVQARHYGFQDFQLDLTYLSM